MDQLLQQSLFKLDSPFYRLLTAQLERRLGLLLSLKRLRGSQLSGLPRTRTRKHKHFINNRNENTP
jgi:hypothetical protein